MKFRFHINNNIWSPALFGDRTFWLQWLKKYKSFKCLWNVGERKTANRRQCNEAYQELADMARTVIPDANILFVKTRLHCFRSCYKREAKKVKQSKENGQNYEPQLFYYNVLKFLDEEDDIVAETDTDSLNANEQNFVVLNSEDDSLGQIETEDINQSIEEQPERRRKRVLSNNAFQENQNFPEEPDDSDTRSELDFEPKRARYDEFELFGRRIAEHFRKMESDQSLIAEKIISEICVYGRMKALTMESIFQLQPSTNSEKTIFLKEIITNDCENCE